MLRGEGAEGPGRDSATHTGGRSTGPTGTLALVASATCSFVALAGAVLPCPSPVPSEGFVYVSHNRLRFSLTFTMWVTYKEAEPYHQEPVSVFF